MINIVVVFICSNNRVLIVLVFVNVSIRSLKILLIDIRMYRLMIK